MTSPDPEQPQYIYVQPPPPEKKRRNWPWIVGAGAVLLCILPGALKSGGSSHSGSRSTTAAAVAEGLNSPVRDGKFEFVVTDVDRGIPEVGRSPLSNRKAKGQFVVVTMTVQNTGDEPRGFGQGNQYLYDERGRKFEHDPKAELGVDGSDISGFDTLNPGFTVTVKTVFDIPVDAHPKEVELHDSMLSDGVKVSLR